MKISTLDTYRLSVPLSKPFKTALRTVYTAETVVVKLVCDNGYVGWGEAPPTVVITGDSMSSIDSAIQEVIKPLLIGRSLLNSEALFYDLEKALVHNVSAKAAVDMAIYDCLAQNAEMPLYQYLGGYQSEVATDFTVSVNEPEEMGEDAVRYVNEGFSVLKVKVGKDHIKKDIERIKEIRARVGQDIRIRLDANQGWEVKEAVSAIRKIEDMGLDIELVEQPVTALDIVGLKQVTEAVETPIMADESVFSPLQAFEVLKLRAADMINIKLMKAGGIYNAQKINHLAEVCGVKCMVGSMIETKLGITAAAHFAASKKNIVSYDFDAPLMLSRDPIQGGVVYEGHRIKMPGAPGLGIQAIDFGGGTSE
ncbi:o-succinylbenzoate synthase [Pullulanibacillus pueri]|uniref:Dipeptide epimerase n=1 Tax=Pullulanibacillus pueri TaxID=1437324 RepID=A0A8J2ZR03_9BACL|nr:dipeptide epimerase [Pullulanibacillus pueri]MBM7679980.1 o-succinylbenzoate synthase [Pullulanibacillus pueri]GGH73776.1 L-Ala-D/L-Glu epimerase [Pullulanibacillus pueri]